MPLSFSLCETLYLASNYVQGWISRQPKVNEESITDWFLDWSALQCPQLRYTLFSHHQEARLTGADWEWWILSGTTALKLRVQAKKLKGAGDNYSEIARTNSRGLQIEMLIRNARQTNAVPLYAFYTAGGGQCNDAAICNQDHSELAIFLADADQIRSTFIVPGRRRVTKREVLDHCRSLHCVFCCRRALPNKSDGVEALTQFVSYHRAGAPSDVRRAVFGQQQGFVSDIPSSILTFAQIDTPDERSGWVKEHRRDFQSVDALVVVDLERNE
ncbi:DUF6615 family protein [Verrucomicrobiota bacterium sgz303538]